MTTTAHIYVAVASSPPPGKPQRVLPRADRGPDGQPPHPQPEAVAREFTVLVTTYDTAQIATKTRAAGTVGVRNAAKTALKAGIRGVVSSVQLAADADPENAEAIITSTSLSVRKTAIRIKAPFAVKQGAVSGSVILSVRSAGNTLPTTGR